MADTGNPKPLAGILLLLVLTAWCFASNSLHAEGHAPRTRAECRELYADIEKADLTPAGLECFREAGEGEELSSR